ncbi:MAG: hypothetical protein LBT97_07335 [Planctomycetota bacterium]|jgi:hypothetical protein|nr:hypothetical protein [Planctomycetota bacterium]
MRASVLVVAFAIALGIMGCGASNQTAAKRPANPGETPDVLVSRAVEARSSLSSLAGKGTMRIVDTPSDFGLTVNADVVADENNRLRIRGDKLAGAIQAFDVVKVGDDIGFYVPTQKTLYHGKVADLKYFAFRFDPDEVLRQMLRPDTSLVLRHWRRAEADARDRSGNIIVDEDVPAGRPRLRLAINSRNRLLASVTQLDAAGQPVLVKSFGDYRSLYAGGRAARSRRSESAASFPFLMTLSWPGERRMMELHFKAVEGNAIVYDEDFDLAASSDTRYLPLTEARMDDLDASTDIPAYDDPLAAAPQAARRGGIM